MTTMLEKMARAMAADHFGALGGPDVWERALSEIQRENYLSQARAALLAIREPDSVMMMARIGPADEPYWYERALEADFTAMIDRILNEKPETTA